MISIEAGDGTKLNLYVAGPDDAKTGVLIVHDWFGVSDFTKASVNRLSAMGIKTIAVDLYGGKSAKTHEEAGVLSGALDADAAQKALQSDLKELSQDQQKIAIIGYSMGGSIALRAATENRDVVTASAIMYGSGFEEIDDAALKGAGPILTVVGSGDDWSYPQHVAFMERMRSLDHNIEAYVYPGVDHAFAQPLYKAGEAYDASATDAMHNVLDAFLSHHLGPNS
jgi:carboxymethylenebutenolidase